MGANKQDLFASVVAIIGDDPAILRPYVDEVCRHLDERYTNYEVVMVDNGAGPEVVAAVRPLLAEYKCVRLVRLSRKMDDETAILAGLDSTIGDFVVTMDPNLDPPNQIGPMIEQCQAGSDLVLGVDRGRLPASPLYRFGRRLLLSLVRWLVGVRLVRGATMLRAMDRQSVNALTQNRLRKRYFQVVAADVGLTTATHHYDSICRSGQPPKPRFFRAVRKGLSVLVHNSTVPLRLVSVLGILGSFLSLFASLYTVAIFFFKGAVPGWTTTNLLVSGLLFVLFLMITLIGEYLGRVLDQTSDRPLYHVREEQSSAVMLSDATRRNVLNQSVNDPRSPTEAR
ncbi:MAG: glycosyltransferase [Gemmataceae bacterium]